MFAAPVTTSSAQTPCLCRARRKRTFGTMPSRSRPPWIIRRSRVAQWAWAAIGHVVVETPTSLKGCESLGPVDGFHGKFNLKWNGWWFGLAFGGHWPILQLVEVTLVKESNGDPAIQLPLMGSHLYGLWEHWGCFNSWITHYSWKIHINKRPSFLSQIGDLPSRSIKYARLINMDLPWISIKQMSPKLLGCPNCGLRPVASTQWIAQFTVYLHSSAVLHTALFTSCVLGFMNPTHAKYLLFSDPKAIWHFSDIFFS